VQPWRFASPSARSGASGRHSHRPRPVHFGSFPVNLRFLNPKLFHGFFSPPFWKLSQGSKFSNPRFFKKKIGGKKTMGSMTEPWELDEKSLKP